MLYSRGGVPSAFHAARQSNCRLHSKYKKYVHLINSSINYVVWYFILRIWINFNKAHVERCAENVHSCDYTIIRWYTGHILVCYRKDTFDTRLVPSYSWLPPPVAVTHRTVDAWQAERAYIQSDHPCCYKLKWSGIFKMATSKKRIVAEECRSFQEK